MGERNNIYIEGLSSLSAIDEDQLPARYYIYGHWAGGRMAEIAVNALLCARGREGDESYWLRQFIHHAFDAMTEPEGVSCGFGIGWPDDQDGYWTPIRVNYAKRIIRCGGVDYAFDVVYENTDTALEVLRRAESDAMEPEPAR